MTDTLDVIVIGAGMAGISAAKKCALAGWSVAIVDELPYGGTCALRGCDPKKMLRAGAEVVEAARRLAGKGVTGETRIDWPALMKHKESFTDPVPENMESGLKEAGVRTLHGRARFTAEDRIEIDGHGEIAFRHALIATGAKRAHVRPGLRRADQRLFAGDQAGADGGAGEIDACGLSDGSVRHRLGVLK